jgi:hypothetical protein
MNYKKPLNLNLKKGALHEALGVPQEKKIPEDKLESALGSSSPLMRKRAQFAKNAKSWNHAK